MPSTAGRLQWDTKNNTTKASIGASFYVNGRLEKAFASSYVVDLKPGTYELKWTAIGYEDYQDTTGIIAGKFLHAPPIYFIVATLIFIIFSLLKRFRFYFLILAIFSLGILRISLTTIFPTNHINSIVQSYPQLMQPINGRITSEVRKVKDSFRFTLEIDEIADVKVDGKINFSTRQTDLKYGDVVSMVAFIRK